LEVGYSDHLTKEQLNEIIKKLLEIDVELNFLYKLSRSELEMFVAAVRIRAENF